MRASDRRFGGLSALAIDGGQFLTVSDRGAVARFSRPFDSSPNLWVADLRDGPRPWGEKWARDAESLVGDPQGRGWWVGYEQSHSLWLYDPGFRNALTAIDLRQTNWPANRGAEGLLVQDGSLLALAEGGAGAVRVVNGRSVPLKLYATTSIADAARAPDGSAWILTRLNRLNGIEQSIAPLVEAHDGYRVGMSWPVPKARFDNYEGMAIEARPEGGWRFWLVTDDGHRFLARNLLVALDLELPIRHRKSPARRTGLSNRRKP